MLIALAGDARIGPRREVAAVCPLCRTPVIAKMGDVKIHHWAHKATLSECDPFKEHESEWHLGWKSRFPEDVREIVEGPHRADVRFQKGLVVEFQKSAISDENVLAREMWWKRILWVFDAAEPYAAGRLRINADGDMEWDAPRRAWLVPKRAPWLDLGDGTLWRPKGRIYWTDPPRPDRPRGLEGGGELWSADGFVEYAGERGRLNCIEAAKS